MAKAAARFVDVFVMAGLPNDFIARLTAAADALVMSLAERSQSRGKRRGATKGLKTKLTSGRKIVHVLDAFVRSALKDDPALLANWNQIKRVRRTPERAPLILPVAGTVTPPTPATEPPSNPLAPAATS